jgi:hypothetical protein
MSHPIVVDEAARALRAMPMQPDTAAVVHAAAVTALVSAGFEVYVEVRVDLPDGGFGRYDIVAHHPRGAVAIEIDARKPRRKSLAKLRQFDGGRIVALRGVADLTKPEGIDAVVSIRVRVARQSEIKDKTAVGRAVRMAVLA